MSASSTCDPTMMPPRIHDFVSLVKPNCKATARGWDGILIVNSAAWVPKDILVHEGLNKCLANGYRIRLSALNQARMFWRSSGDASCKN